MIIQVRGTSGSGKTTVVRRVMESIPGWTPEYIEGRKRPLYYRTETLAILGHYEVACGGGDTIGSAAQCYKEIVALTQMGYNVLCEGLLLSEDVKWASQLEDLRIVYLTTPIETCLDRISKRRKESGNLKPLNPSNTTNRLGPIERSRLKLIEAGAKCVRASTEQAIAIVMRWLDEI